MAQHERPQAVADRDGATTVFRGIAATLADSLFDLPYESRDFGRLQTLTRYGCPRRCGAMVLLALGSYEIDAANRQRDDEAS